VEDKEDLTGLTDDERRRLGRSPDPVLPGQPSTAVDPPGPVRVSFWVWLAGGVVLIGGQVFTLAIKQQLIDALIRQNRESGQQVDAVALANGATTAFWLLLGGSVVFSLLIVLFAYKAREGTRSARTVLTGFAVACVLFQAGIFFSIPSVIATLLFVIALVLMYLPAVAGYFPKAGRKP
jgi:magnesium-transporting ATPase (P-type)